MKHYGLEIPEGTSGVVNLTVPTGTAFPNLENAGELFFRTDENKLYVHGTGTGSPTDWLSLALGQDYLPLTGGTLTGSLDVNDTVISSTGIEINENGSGDRSARIDFHADDTNTNYSFRILRNSGINGDLNMVNKGDGDVNIQAEGAGDVVLSPSGSGSTDIRIKNTGVIQSSLATYETLVTLDDHIPNKKYVDDAITAAGTGGINDVVEDLTPQLGGDLDTNNFDIEFSAGTEIRGDFSNATVNNRTAVVNSTPNATTVMLVKPSGTGNQSYITTANSYDATNASTAYLGVTTSEAFFASSKFGTGSTLPIKFRMVSDTVFEIETDGTLNVSAQTDYENKVTADDDIPNKKYVDDAITTGVSGTSHISNVVEDTTPQLGGTLDLNSNVISGTAGASTAFSATLDDFINMTLTSGDVNNLKHPSVNLAAARGTIASPNALQTGDRIGIYAFRGRGASSYFTAGGMFAEPTQTWTNTAQGMDIGIEVQPDGSTGSGNRIEALRLKQNGLLQVDSAISYETLVAADDDIPNKKYVDDAITTGSGISNVVEDTTPQLGGDLDANSFDIQLQNGTATDPSLTFSGDTNTGLYWPANDRLGFSAAGLDHMTVGGLVVQMGTNTQLRIQSGTQSAPGIGFTGDPDAGFWLKSPGNPAGGVGNNQVFEWDTNAFYIKQGSVSQPSLRFSDMTTQQGFYYNSAEDALSYAYNGVEYWRLDNGLLKSITGGRFSASSGNETSPGIYFGSNTSTGFHTSNSDRIIFSIEGSNNFTWLDTQHISHVDGSAAAPAFTWLNDLDTGIYHSTNILAFSTSGVSRLEIEANGTLNVSGTTNYETLITSDDDIPNKKYVDDAITTGGLQNIVEDTTPQLGGDLDVNSNTITGLPAIPTLSTEATSKSYVDSLAVGLDPKESCRAASTGNVAGTFASGSPAGVGTTLTLTGSPTSSLTIDDVTLVNGDRLLLKDQTAALQNGIYVVSGVGSAVVLTRATDFDDSPTNEVDGGEYTFISEGTLNIGKSYVVISGSTIHMDNDPINWTQASGGGSFLPLAGGTMSGNIAMGGNDLTGVDTITATGSGSRIADHAFTNNYIDVAYYDTGDRNSIIDFISADADQSTYSMRFRRNPGINGNAHWYQKGTGDVYIIRDTAGLIVFRPESADTSKDIRIDASGTLFSGNTTYETLVTSDDDIPNKKYVDDAITAGAFIHPDPHLLGNGTAGAPTYAFSSATDTGIFRPRADVLGLVSNGVTRIELDDQKVRLINQSELRVEPGVGVEDRFIRLRSWTTIGSWIQGVSTYDAKRKTYVDSIYTGAGSPMAGDLDLVFRVGQEAGPLECLTITEDGRLTVGAANYETLVTADDHVPNKKYVDDAITSGSGIDNVVEDLTPQLGGDLDLNGNEILFDGTTNNRMFWNNTDSTIDIEINGDAVASFDDGRIWNYRTGSEAAFISSHASDTPLSAGRFVAYRARNTIAAPANVQTGDNICELNSVAYAGDDYQPFVASITTTIASGTISATSIPTEMTFWTTPDGASSASNRFTIESNGTLNVAGTSTYETLVTSDDDIPNKKYVDDAITAGAFIHPDPHLLGNGTVSAPTYSFTGDTDTGMYSSGANQIAFATVGVQRLQLNAGTSTLTTNLRIEHAAPILEFSETTGGSPESKKWYVVADGNDFDLRENSTSGTDRRFSFNDDQSTTFYTNQISRLVIESDGTLNVGATPTYETLVTDDDDIPNKKYVDDLAGAYLPLTGGTMTGAINTTDLSFLNSKMSGQKSWTFRHTSGDDLVFAPSASIDAEDWDFGNQITFFDNGDIDISGSLFVDNGSVGIPSYSFGIDKDIGMYLYTTGSPEVPAGVGFSVNSDLQFFVSGDGVQIIADSNSPTDYPLTISNSADNYGVQVGAYGMSNRTYGATTIDFTLDIGDDLIIKTDSTERARFFGGGSEVLRLTAISVGSPVDGTEVAFMTFYHSNGTRMGYVGDGSASKEVMALVSDLGGVELIADTNIRLITNGTERLEVETNGTLNVAGTTTYETLVTDDDDIPNKKYVDDAITTAGSSYVLKVGDTMTGSLDVDDTVISSTGIEINENGSGDRSARIDFHADDTNTNYSFRILRDSGINGDLNMVNKGNGDVNIQAEGTGDVVLSPSSSGSTDIRIKNTGVIQSSLTTYETLVTLDDHIPNKKYVDDASGNLKSLTATTTNATETEVGTDYLTIATDTSYLVDINIVARRTDALGSPLDRAAWNIKCMIENNSGTTIIVGDTVETEITNGPGWSVSVAADNTNDRLAVKVTGEAAKTINWKANITHTSVS